MSDYLQDSTKGKHRAEVKDLTEMSVREGAEEPTHEICAVPEMISSTN
jgi:hypothetical protein